MKEGSVILIDGVEHEVFHGPWKYETKKKSKTGFGLYIKLNVDYKPYEWKSRCGVEYLNEFGFEYEECKKD